MRNLDWKPIDTVPEGVAVMTKIDDENGARNEQSLRRNGSMWFVPDGSMYVYYRPTHWAEMPGVGFEEGEES
jgi:hypothetical protein